MKDTAHLRRDATVWYPIPHTREPPPPVHAVPLTAGRWGRPPNAPMSINVHSPGPVRGNVAATGAGSGGVSPASADDPGGSLLGGRVAGLKLASEAGGSGGSTPRTRFVLRKYKADDAGGPKSTIDRLKVKIKCNGQAVESSFVERQILGKYSEIQTKHDVTHIMYRQLVNKTWVPQPHRSGIVGEVTVVRTVVLLRHITVHTPAPGTQSHIPLSRGGS